MNCSHINVSMLSITVYYHLAVLTDKRIDNVTIGNNDISLIPSINPNKAAGHDGISGQMLLLIIFRNILATSLYLDIWKLAKT